MNEISTKCDENDSIYNKIIIKKQHMSLKKLCNIASTHFMMQWMELIREYIHDNSINVKVIHDFEKWYYFKNTIISKYIVELIMEIYRYNLHIKNDTIKSIEYKKCINDYINIDTISNYNLEDTIRIIDCIDELVKI